MRSFEAPFVSLHFKASEGVPALLCVLTSKKAIDDGNNAYAISNPLESPTIYSHPKEKVATSLQ